MLFRSHGGTIAGDARRALEAKTGKPVVSQANYLAIEAAGRAPELAVAAPAKALPPSRKRVKAKK